LRPMWREAPIGITDPFVFGLTAILNQNAPPVQDDCRFLNRDRLAVGK